MIFPNNIDPSRIAGTDETRYVLSFVAIEGNHAIAIDGKSMMVSRVFREEEDGKETIFIPRSVLRRARKKQKRFGEETKVTIHPDHFSVRCLDGDPNELRTLRKSDEDLNFPNWRAVLPEGGDRIQVAFSTLRLREMAKALGDDKDGIVCLHLDLKRLESPAIVTTKFNAAFGLVMPAYVKDFFPLENNIAFQWAMSKPAETPAHSDP